MVEISSKVERVMYGKQFCMEVKHGSLEKTRWEFYEEQRVLW